MSNTLPSHLGKKAELNEGIGEKDIRINKLQAEVLRLEIRNAELEREAIQLNKELLNYAATQLDLTHIINGGYDGK